MTLKSYWLVYAMPFAMQIAFAEPPQNIQQLGEQKAFYLRKEETALTLRTEWAGKRCRVPIN